MGRYQTVWTARSAYSVPHNLHNWTKLRAHDIYSRAKPVNFTHPKNINKSLKNNEIDDLTIIGKNIPCPLQAVFGRLPKGGGGLRPPPPFGSSVKDWDRLLFISFDILFSLFSKLVRYRWLFSGPSRAQYYFCCYSLSLFSEYVLPMIVKSLISLFSMILLYLGDV